MKSKPTERTSLVEQPEQKILQTIRNKGLVVGDTLPGELELTESLGVSRSVVREALSRLRMLGLLESRRKRGMILSEPDIFGGCNLVMDTAFLNVETQQDLFEMRLTLEIGLTDLVFLDKTDEDLDKLEKIVELEKKAPTAAARLKHEIEFHRQLYQMSGNETLIRFQALLQPFFQQVSERERKTGRRTGTVDHGKLLKELRTGTPESFRRAMREHLDPHFKSLRSEE